jgi:glyoxylase-like metal-dependent hydrolase (beta-lactamase superfamily II)
MTGEPSMNSPRLILKQAELGPMMNFIYLVGCAETREAAVIDPAWDVPAILRLAEESDLRISRILITHGHPDHINGLEELLEATDARVYMHPDEINYTKEIAARFRVPVDFMNRRSSNFQPVSDGEEITVGRLPVQFLHTPGHTPGSQCFLVEKNLVSGDTLFINACGRVDLPGGDPEKMWWSLNRRLAALDDDTILYPGHNYAERRTSTLGDEKRNNPYLQYTSVNQFLRDMRF